MLQLEFRLEHSTLLLVTLLSYQTPKDGTSQSNNRGAKQSKKNLNASFNNKKKQSKRSVKRNNYIKKLVQKSI